MPFPPEMRQAIKESQGKRCCFCGENNCLEVHHKVPARDGGSNSANNASLLCEPCHEMFDHEQIAGLSYEDAWNKLHGFFYPEI